MRALWVMIHFPITKSTPESLLYQGNESADERRDWVPQVPRDRGPDSRILYLHGLWVFGGINRNQSYVLDCSVDNELLGVCRVCLRSWLVQDSCSCSFGSRFF